MVAGSLSVARLAVASIHNLTPPSTSAYSPLITVCSQIVADDRPAALSKFAIVICHTYLEFGLGSGQLSHEDTFLSTCRHFFICERIGTYRRVESNCTIDNCCRVARGAITTSASRGVRNYKRVDRNSFHTVSYKITISLFFFFLCDMADEAIASHYQVLEELGRK